MTELTYARLVAELFPRAAGGIKWGLDRTERLLEGVGRPDRRFRSVHVAGTNGKGSVAAIIGAVLTASGRRTAIYSSPHLCDFRERFLLDGAPLDEDAVLAAARRLWPEIEASGATFFEATTAIGFLALAEAGAEIAVVEVGLGGRLDATNVITPEVSVITNIGLDHVEYLGTTLAEVAAEKAGIIKPGIPVVTAETNPGPLAIIASRARAAGAPFSALPADVPKAVTVSAGGNGLTVPTSEWGELRLESPLVGRHQARNAALALAALELLPTELRPDRAAVVRGVATARWPGRFQVEVLDGVTWVFDAAHNPPGAAALAGTLDAVPLPRPLVLLCGVLADKDWPAMLPPLARRVDAVVLTVPPSAPAQRRWDPTVAVGAAGPRAQAEPDFGAALRRARLLAGRADAAIGGAAGAGGKPDRAGSSSRGGTVVVTGSLHTVGDALLAIGRPPWGIGAERHPTLPLVAPAV